MAVYWILLILVLCGIPLCAGNSRSLTDGSRVGRIVFCALFGAVLTFIAAFRFSVGYDYNLYASWFYNTNFMSYEEAGVFKREMGIMLIFKAICTVTEDYAAVFPVIALLIYPPLSVYICKYSDNAPLSAAAFLCMGLFFNSMNFMCQFIAAVICAFAFKYAEKGCLWRFAALTVIASAFHRSALIILPCIFFAYVGWNKFTLAAVSAGSALIYIFSEPLLRFATGYVYTYYDIDNSADMTNGLNPWYCIMYGLVFLAAFALRNRLDGEKREINILLWCSFGSFFFELLGTKYAVVSRFALLMFIPAVMLLIPKLWNSVYEAAKKKGKAVRAAAAISAVLLLAANYGYLMHVNYNGAVPYQTVFSRQNGG